MVRADRVPGFNLGLTPMIRRAASMIKRRLLAYLRPPLPPAPVIPEFDPTPYDIHGILVNEIGSVGSDRVRSKLAQYGYKIVRAEFAAAIPASSQARPASLRRGRVAQAATTSE